jgi:hypothetical protein
VLASEPAPGVHDPLVRADEPFVVAPYRPFGLAQDRPFDDAQGRPFDGAQDRPVGALRGHVDRLSANGYGRIATTFS